MCKAHCGRYIPVANFLHLGCCSETVGLLDNQDSLGALAFPHYVRTPLQIQPWPLWEHLIRQPPGPQSTPENMHRKQSSTFRPLAKHFQTSRCQGHSCSILTGRMLSEVAAACNSQAPLRHESSLPKKAAALFTKMSAACSCFASAWKGEADSPHQRPLRVHFHHCCHHLRWTV